MNCAPLMRSAPRRLGCGSDHAERLSVATALSVALTAPSTRIRTNGLTALGEGATHSANAGNRMPPDSRYAILARTRCDKTLVPGRDALTAGFAAGPRRVGRRRSVSGRNALDWPHDRACPSRANPSARLVSGKAYGMARNVVVSAVACPTRALLLVDGVEKLACRVRNEDAGSVTRTGTFIRRVADLGRFVRRAGHGHENGESAEGEKLHYPVDRAHHGHIRCNPRCVQSSPLSFVQPQSA